MSDNNNTGARRYIANLSTLGITQMHLRNPLIVAWWSAAFPGLGHILLSKYLRGYVLVIWELFLNLHAHINTAIIYSFTGRANLEKELLTNRWILFYIPTYLFAIWDSYRTTVEINQQYILASREDAEVDVLKLNAVEINYLDKKVPWVSSAWSALSPGVGELYVNRLPSSFIIAVMWIGIVYLSNFPPAMQYVFLGEFNKATAIIDPQWFLNIPSIYFFAIYDSYVKTVENNKLFDWEQTRYLNKHYLNDNFDMPTSKSINRGEAMYVIATFDHSIYLESAITALETKGIPKESIYAVSMDKRAEQRKLFDSMHSSDGLSTLDIPLVLATALTVLGNIYGFVLKWGPIIWGLIGAFIGLSLGLLIKLYTVKKYSKRQANKKSTEVVVIVECEENQLNMVKDTFWEHNAIGVRKLFKKQDKSVDVSEGK